MSKNNRAIGIDIGGTKTAVGAVDGAGVLVARATFATEAGRGFSHFVERTVAAIHQVLSEAGWSHTDICGIGIGCPGPVDPTRGLINNPYTLEGWDRCDIVTPLRETFVVPVCLENDADSAVTGEAFVGAAKGCERVVLLTLGTGIGSGVLVDGRIYRGANDEHPELGHLPVLSDGPACYCGQKGCFEALASGTAIATAGKAVGLGDCPRVFAAAAQGNPAAQQIIQRATSAASAAAWAILCTFLPQRMILGGGIIDDHFELFAAPFRAAIAAASMVPRESIKVVHAQLGNDAGMVGAACLAFGHEKRQDC